MSNIGFKRNKGNIHKIHFLLILLVTFLLLAGVVKPLATEMLLMAGEEPAKQLTLQILVQFQVEAY